MIPFTTEIDFFLSVKSGITYVISHNYAKVKEDWYDSLPIRKNNEFS